MIDVSSVVARAIDFYQILIIAYVLLSWLPASGVIWEIRRILGTVVEPYIGIFRKIVPSLGMIDISPIVAILVLSWLIRPLLVTALVAIGL
ncbi:MAG: YggT family protein [Actinobacteria bacterium]|nr:YggT family protein [Actinomycetota bacterium]MCL5887283.1 YggT family protein [Actinomycetota bacterium]